MNTSANNYRDSYKVIVVEKESQFPLWIASEFLIEFLHENMKPYEDSIMAVQYGVDFALSGDPSQGGFAVLAIDEFQLIGAVVVVNTGLKHCVPEHLLLYACVLPQRRGRGIGRKLLAAAIEHCGGSVTLHVEHENPAKHLYEQLGFVEKYADMRLTK